MNTADLLTELTTAQEAMERSLAGANALVAELDAAKKEVDILKRKYRNLRRFVGAALLTQLQTVIQDGSDDEISLLTAEGTSLKPNDSFDQVINSLRPRPDDETEEDDSKAEEDDLNAMDLGEDVGSPSHSMRSLALQYPEATSSMASVPEENNPPSTYVTAQEGSESSSEQAPEDDGRRHFFLRSEKKRGANSPIASSLSKKSKRS